MTPTPTERIDTNYVKLMLLPRATPTKKKSEEKTCPLLSLRWGWFIPSHPVGFHGLWLVDIQGLWLVAIGWHGFSWGSNHKDCFRALGQRWDFRGWLPELYFHAWKFQQKEPSMLGTGLRVSIPHLCFLRYDWNGKNWKHGLSPTNFQDNFIIFPYILITN